MSMAQLYNIFYSCKNFGVILLLLLLLLLLLYIIITIITIIIIRHDKKANIPQLPMLPEWTPR